MFVLVCTFGRGEWMQRLQRTKLFEKTCVGCLFASWELGEVHDDAMTEWDVGTVGVFLMGSTRVWKCTPGARLLP